ncbi:hypothetical protein [Paraburkholderia acidiphila]|uniref:hypothetical protein n=1 Tax=Paraburkholderia acidiphila TaxID=2571747 RepID=UPI001E51AA74|nr:hypothetical protein [Paraburkholderia acidiphila]
MSNAPSLHLDSATLIEACDRPGVRQFHHGRQRLAKALEAHRGALGYALTRRMIIATAHKPLAH